ncbi:MAG: Fe-S-binding domain-containing protein, partial [Steroidobacteraceae bacterium]
MLLSMSVALPLVGALLLLLTPNRDRRNDGLIRWVTLAVSIAAFGVTLAIWAGFDAASPEFQFVERRSWIPAFGIDYFVGIDGISLLLVVLTGFLTPIALL